MVRLLARTSEPMASLFVLLGVVLFDLISVRASPFMLLVNVLRYDTHCGANSYDVFYRVPPGLPLCEPRNCMARVV